MTITQATLECFAAYLKSKERSELTIEKYLRDVRKFAGYLNGDEVTKEAVTGFKEMLCEKGYAIRSINSMLAAINSFLIYVGLENCTVCQMKLQHQIYCPAEKELSQGEYERLLHAAEKKSVLWLIMQTICATGIRVSELQYFTAEAVRRGEVIVRCKNKTRSILMPQQLCRLLQRYMKQHRICEGTIFRGRSGKPISRGWIWAQMKAICREAGVLPTKVFPHNLRKLFARTFYKMQHDIAKLADVLGHSNINTTRIYLLTSGTEHRRIIDSLGLVCRKLPAVLNE